MSRNALFSAFGAVIATACLFLVYRVVVREVGLAQLGLWSLLTAVSGVVRLADVSGAGALARFVALPSASLRGTKRDLIHTVLLTSVGFNLLLCVALVIAAPFLVPQLFAAQHHREAALLIPFIVAMTLVSSVGTGLMSALDGTQRADLRVLTVTLASVTLLAAALLLVPRSGILGFAAAQVLQQLVLVGVGWALLRRQIPGLGWVPTSWRPGIFRETAAFALKLNAISIAVMLFEPAAKVVINSAAGPAAVALYDIASRLVAQVRGFFVSAAVPLVPAFAAQQPGAAFQQLLRRSTLAASIGAVASSAATLVLAPLASLILFDRIQPQLFGFTALLSAGWSISLISVPIYFAAQAQGVLRWNLLGHVLTALSLLIGAAWAVAPFGVSGLIGAISLGLMVSGVCNVVGNTVSLTAAHTIRSIAGPILLSVTLILAMCAMFWLLALGS